MATNRKIEDVLQFRTDISPFLIHLTKKRDNIPAKDNLKSIISKKALNQYQNKVSGAALGLGKGYATLTADDIFKYYSGICFTETPLNEIHSLMDIAGRQVDLQPYGFVFIQDKLKMKGVSPVLYLNNWPNDKSATLAALRSLIQSHPDQAAEILPLIDFFGKTIGSVTSTGNDEKDFSWEREWRYPSVKGDFQIAHEDIFVGLCPDNEIQEFEKLALENLGTQIAFIDPTKNMKYYASKLIEAKKRIADFNYSVI